MRVATGVIWVLGTAAIAAARSTRPVRPTATTAPAATADSRKPHAAPTVGETRELSIKELGNFDYDPDENTPIPPT